MASRKHDLPDEPDLNENQPPAKQSRLLRPNQPMTEQVLNRFCTLKGLEMEKPQFVALCGYLCALLRWGLAVRVHDLDSFITMYPGFSEALPQIEQDAVQTDDPPLPAYHQWYMSRIQQEQDSDARVGGECVLDEASLRGIWAENPYTFLRIEHSLRFIASENKPSVPRSNQG